MSEKYLEEILKEKKIEVVLKNTLTTRTVYFTEDTIDNLNNLKNEIKKVFEENICLGGL